MSKKKKLEVAQEPQVPAVDPIDPKLLQSVAALQGIATCHNLLDQGSFQYKYSQAIAQSLEFLKVLHSQVKDECLKHPDSDKIPELVALKAQTQVKGE